MMSSREKWKEFCQLTTWGKVAGAIFVSLSLLLASYVVCNTSIPLPDEMGVLQGWDKFKSLNGLNKDSIPSEVLLVNVSYDKQLVDYEQNGFPIGQYAITDRQKLYDFLRIAKDADNYKYILLDVFFEKGIVSEQDSMLFHLLSSMDRIVIPAHHDMSLQDPILYKKAANADYTVTWQDTNFSRFKYSWDGFSTIPLKMYQELDGKDITKHGFIYTCDGWICKNAITLELPIKMVADKNSADPLQKLNILQLGCDLLAMDSIAPISKAIKDKIVVLGDFYTDIHDTYIGPQPGSLICLNAYFALQRGDHIVWGKYGSRLLFYLIVAIIYFTIAICYLNGFTISSITEITWLKAIISFGSIGVLFWGIAILGFLLFNTVYNLWIPIVFFSAFGTIIYIYGLIKELRHEKAKTNAATSGDVPDHCDSGQLQDTLSEQQSDLG